MTSIRLCLAAALLLLPTLLHAGESRSWTDRQGRQIEAEFVRVFNGTAILKQGTRILRVPFNNLSEADQAFINNGGQELPEEADQPQALDAPTTPEQRTWTDVDGNQIQATYVRMHDNQLVLKAGGRVKSIGIEKFSASDHAYVKQMLTAQGKQDQADALDQYVANQQQAAANNNAATRAGAVPPAFRQPNLPPTPSLGAGDSFVQQQMAESRRRMEEQQQRMEQQREQERQRREQAMLRHQEQMAQQQRDTEIHRQQREQERRERDAEMQRQREEMLANNSRPQNNRVDIPSPSIPSSPSYSHNSGPAYEVVYECTGCNKEVPASYGAGSKCPHCGITFAYVEDENGKKEYADGYTAYGSIGFIVLTILGIGVRVIIAMARS